VIRLDQISKQHGPQILFVDASADAVGGTSGFPFGAD